MQRHGSSDQRPVGRAGHTLGHTFRVGPASSDIAWSPAEAAGYARRATAQAAPLQADQQQLQQEEQGTGSTSDPDCIHTGFTNMGSTSRAAAQCIPVQTADACPCRLIRVQQMLRLACAKVGICPRVLGRILAGSLDMK